MESRLASLHAVADRFHLPARWVKDEALAGRIPVLKIGRLLFFDLAAVERSLAQRAAAPGGGDNVP